MRILWFEITEPGQYVSDKAPVGGWQDSLQDIIMTHNDIELAIAFEHAGKGERREIEGVKYYPINITYSFFERQRNKYSWEVSIGKILDKALAVIDDFKPDLIQVFGSEWCFGLLAERTNIPIVIHMQGSIPPYNNALMPPLYSVWDLIIGMGWSPRTQFNAWLGRKKDKSRQEMEERILRSVNYYMGRTAWDKNIVRLFNPNCHYYYCSEALRKSFVEAAKLWRPPKNKKFKIVTTGISSFWKGIDTILRTAHLLKERGFDFEWICAGKMNPLHKKIVEHKEHLKYEENNVKIAGFLNQEQLQQLLLSTDLYVHTAYIDNSPNAVCEAQYLGLPIVATYVGGIPSLIENGKEGVLIPANDPFTLAGKIIELSSDVDTCISMGQASHERAVARHNPDMIYHDLLTCYNEIIKMQSR